MKAAPRLRTELLKQKRIQAGMSQNELAIRSKVHQTYVGKLEKNLRNPTLEIAAAMAKALDTKLSKMIAEAEKRLETQ
jgi:transcriptional regulator with XRE-family HTH domain